MTSRLNRIKIIPEATWMKVLMFAELAVALVFMVLMTLMDAFPKSIVAALLLVLVGFLVLSIILMNSRKRRNTERILGAVFASIVILLYGTISYYLAATFSMFERISTSEIESSGVDVTSKPFNVYITGIDNCGEDGGIDTFGRSDVNMLVTINPRTRTIMLTSMPRDSYVALHRTGTMDKLTHTGIYGVQETLDTVEDWLGVKSDFYFKVNFMAFVDVVDAMGGVDVESDMEFDPGDDARNTDGSHCEPFHVTKGMNHFNGVQALAFARERSCFDVENGDEVRIRHQQMVVSALIDKACTSKTLLTKYTKILDAVSANMRTNMSTKDMNAIIKMQLQYLGKWTIKSQAVSGTGGMATVASMDSSNQYFVSFPNPDTVEAVKQGINAVMNPTKEELEAAEASEKKNKQVSAAKSFLKN